MYNCVYQDRHEPVFGELLISCFCATISTATESIDTSIETMISVRRDIWLFFACIGLGELNTEMPMGRSKSTSYLIIT